MLTKAQLRESCLARRAALTTAKRRQMSAAIAEHVCAMPAFQDSQTVMLYMALPQEAQTAAILAESRYQGKRVTVPVVKPCGLVAAELPTGQLQFQPGPFDIPEPAVSTAIIPPEDINCVMVPGIAFDRRGARLGFGKGYYDRFLCRLPATTYVCGLAFSVQIVQHVPDLPHDVRMQSLVTEQGVLLCEDTR
jgi:5-formyltetrahydrofolate cyclo-ligase